MPCKASESGLLQAGFAGLADLLTASVVLVVGGDVADPGVEPDAVVVLPNHGELGAQSDGVSDGEEVGVLDLDGPVQRADPGLVCGRPGPTDVLAIAHSARNSRVEPEVICGPRHATPPRARQQRQHPPNTLATVTQSASPGGRLWISQPQVSPTGQAPSPIQAPSHPNRRKNTA